MSNTWHDVWNRREQHATATLDLDQLIALDGFDSGAGKIAADSWREYASRVATKLSIAPRDSVYEVGCGSGAFLAALSECADITVGGCDYSKNLVNVACKVFPGSDFQHLEAIKIDPEARYDLVVSNAVFHYFDKHYASAVLSKMLEKARRAVCILEVPDAATMQESENLRRDLLTPDEYARKYAGLEHTYYQRSWFSEIANAHGCRSETFTGLVPNYAQNRFRFGCIIWKDQRSARTETDCIQAKND